MEILSGIANPLRSVIDRYSDSNRDFEDLFPYLLLIPLVLFLIFVLWIPFIRGIWISLFNWPFGTGDPEFIGLDNYVTLLSGEMFYTGLKATVIYGLATFLQLGIALAAALAVSKVRFKSIFSSAFLLPYTMPPVATGTLWLFIMLPNLGPFSKLAEEYGILTELIYWPNSGDLSLMIITLVSAWTFWPFMFLILYATIVGIPKEYYENARVYGANRIQMFRRITLPQIKTAIYVVVALRVVWNLTKVSQPIQLTNGGPGFDTSLLSIILFRFAFIQGNLGIGYAVGIIFLLLVLGFIIMFFKYYEKYEGV